MLTSRKGITLPSRSISVDFLSEKDREDILFGIRHDVDYIALSFVRSVSDIESVRDILDEQGASVPLIAKIEKHEALSQLDAILDNVQGVMIARGDLGVEIPIEKVPVIQKEIIRSANSKAIPVITATQMMRSMVDSPRPTRAEVADVANAVLDGTDAVMLSEETAVGSYPVEALKMLCKVAAEAEKVFSPVESLPEAERVSSSAAVAEAAADTASGMGASAVVACTQSGSTARLISRARPGVPVLALTPDVNVYRQLALSRGLYPLLMDPMDNYDDMEQEALERASAVDFVNKGDVVVLVAGVPLQVPGMTNMMKVAKAL
jgi:pyruvate kinase